MSRENVEVVRALVEPWRHGDFLAVDWADPDIEFFFSAGANPDAATYRGLGGMARGFREWLGPWHDFRVEAEEFIDAGDHVLVRTRLRGRGRGSGVEIDSVGYSLFTLRAGKVVRLGLYMSDREQAFTDAGVREQPISPGNVELGREVLDALSRRDVSRLVTLSDPEVEWRSFFAIGEEGVYRGHDGTRRYLSDLDDAFEIGRADVDDALAVGDIAVLVGRIHYRGKASGVETETSAGWVLKFRNGRVVSFRAFRDPEQALEAVGLRE